MTIENPNSLIQLRDVSVFYGSIKSVFHISMDIPKNSVTAFIGPSGCGKSTILRCFNRMNDEISNCKIEGKIFVHGTDIYSPSVSVEVIRSRIGMVFQKPNPFPKSIYENIAYAPTIHNLYNTKEERDKIVKDSLIDVGLWDEVKDRLHKKGTQLSGGQQQRLCIARAIAANPEIILMDEPCSALDPIATAKIEKLIKQLGKKYTIIIVTHSMSQAKRISDQTAFFHMGELIEYDATQNIFNNPQEEKTKNYINGDFG